MTIHAAEATSPRHRRVPAAVLAACLLIAPAVSGCSFNPLESVIEGATGGNVDVGGTSVPDDFPAEVPLIEGEVASAFAVGKAPEKIWNVTIKVADASALETIKTEMEAAGFTSDLEDAAIGDITGGMYSNGTYSVLVVVAEDGDSGWAAAYTVTPAVE
ncbi:MAG TPA: hypothetical protein VFT01_02145 [Homoserinimonas sp.]|nr:hypothetical protein [Homoserinimonas sp.]